MLTDDLLIAGCLNKDKKCEDLLYQKFASIAFALCLRYVSNIDDAKDVFQEGFVKVYGQLQHFKLQGSFDGWVKRIFVNTALDYCRKKKKIAFVSVDDFTSNIEDLDETVDAELPKEKLMELIMNLPDGYRIIFNMYVIENYTHKQVKANYSRQGKYYKHKSRN